MAWGCRHPVDEHRAEVVGEVGVEDAPLERGLVGAAEGIEQHVDGEHARAVGGGSQHVGQADRRVRGSGRHADLAPCGAHRGLELELVGRAGVARLCRVEALVNEGQLAVYVKVAIENRVAVGQGVVARMVVQELLVGEGGDLAGVAARLVGVCRVREQGCREGLVEDVVGIGERAFHLVEDHAVVGERRVIPLARDLEVPALLLEDAGALVDGRVQNRVQVDAHEVLQVGRVGGGHRVHGLVGEGHGVQEGLHARLEQVDEGLLDGVARGPAQDGVLEDVEDPRVVGRRGLEGDGEGLVGVCTGEPEGTRAGGVVAHDVGRARDLGEGHRPGDGEAGVGGACGECGVKGVKALLCVVHGCLRELSFIWVSIPYLRRC
jgi:hypothetical protein